MVECPPESLFDRLLAGFLSDAEETLLDAHLRACDTCCSVLDEKTNIEDSWRDTLANRANGEKDDDDRRDTKSLDSTVLGRRKQKRADQLAQATKVPGYELVEEIGRGGVGLIFRARQIALDRIVALKVMLPGTFPTQNELARFRLEAEAVAKLRHPNVIQIFDVIEREDNPCLCMEYIKGEDLAKRLGGTPQSPEAAARLVELLAEGIRAVHEAGILHRDLKPANILLATSIDAKTGVTLVTGDGSVELVQPKITDFGLAKNIEQDGGLTQTQTVMGTPSYMSPEQAREGTTVTRSADIYSLGAILYKVLVGRPPFQGSSAVETLAQVFHEDPVPPRRIVNAISVDLDAVCLKCLEKDPTRRYESAEELAADLRRVQDGEPTIARPITNAERVWRWCRRRFRPLVKRYRTGFPPAGSLSKVSDSHHVNLPPSPSFLAQSH